MTYLRSTDGSDPAMLGDGKALALSPDGKLALVTVPTPEPHLVLLPTGVGEARALPGGAAVQYHWANFFPDGRRILFVADERDRPSRSYIQDVAGGAPRPFAEEGIRAELVSPDGAEIAGSTQEGLPLIFPVRRERPGSRSSTVSSRASRWSSGVKTASRSSSAESPKQPLVVYRVDLKTGKKERWLELSPADNAGFIQFGAGPKGVRITPDGRFYAYTFWSSFGRLVVTDVGKQWWK